MIEFLTNEYRQFQIPDGYETVEMDMGCGRGRFTLALAARYPERLIIGSDVMIGRLRRIEAKVEKRDVGNIRLLRAESGALAEFQMPSHCIDRLHILCPDPWPKDKGKARRLVCSAFLCTLPRILKPGGILHLSTDHYPYHKDWKGLMDSLPFFREEPDAMADVTDIKTDFELQWEAEGKEVRHLAYRLI